MQLLPLGALRTPLSLFWYDISLRSPGACRNLWDIGAGSGSRRDSFFLVLGALLAAWVVADVADVVAHRVLERPSPR